MVLVNIGFNVGYGWKGKGMRDRKGFILIGVVLFIALIFAASYPLIMNNLIVDEKPVQSDVIIVAEGEDIGRAYRASELLAEGISTSGQVIVSPLTEENAQSYQSFGIGQEQIIPETEAASTYKNAVITLGMMEEYGFDSAIVISSDYHMLRTRMIYERINQDYGYELTYVAAYHLIEGELMPWYEVGPRMEQVARQEFWKYWGYWLGLYRLFSM